MSSGEAADVRRQAGWLPADQADLEEWLAGRSADAEGGSAPTHPVIEEFQALIERDPVVRMYLEQMIAQQPRGREYQKRHLTGVPQLLRLINAVLRTAPEYGADSTVMTPLGAVLDWTMATPAGFAAYRDPRINAMFGKILRAYGEFLDSPDSRHTLNDSPSGWKSPGARASIGIEQFEHDPDDPHWGFRSWNDFFTRRFRAGQRPVADAGDDAVIVNACESTPYGLATDVRLEDRFWIKSQPYSLRDMLAGDPAAERFAGGAVYQAFLSAVNYHRWHSPVSGTVVRAFAQPGTYYSEADSEGEAAAEPRNSQSYLAHVATRAVVLIEADHPGVGLLGFVAVGMTDVSSCLLRPELRPGARVAKGEELGRFQFGGSTYCLLFRPGAVKAVALGAVPGPQASVLPVNQALAFA